MMVCLIVRAGIFRVMGGMDVNCVNITVLQLARAKKLYREFRLLDDEYRQLLVFILRDFSGSL